MKKALSILCLLVLCLTLLCACGAQDIKSEIKDIVSPTEPTTARPTATVTFPEGYTLVQIAEKLEESGVCSASEFVALTNNKEHIASLGYAFLDTLFEKDRAFYLEGYVFPDTYEFYLNDKAENVLSKILKNTDSKLTAEYEARAAEIGYTLDEIITVASIIQEEAFTDESMLLISSVLHNRLESPDYPKLQCDVTVFYYRDYIKDSPYLTGDTEKYKALYDAYECLGIPQGAICCPGVKAIEAALYPAESNYYCFFTDSEKNYHFSETFEEHQAKWSKISS